MERWREPWIEQDRRTKHWFLRWRERSEDGKIHRRSGLCESYSDAINQKNLKRDELLEARKNTHNPHAKIEPLYVIYMREMENVRQLRLGAILAKRLALTPFIKQMKVLGSVFRESIRDYRDVLLSSHLNPITVGIRMREIKAFVRWLHFEGHLKENPWVKIELPRSEPTPRFLTTDELVTLEGVCKGQLLAIVRMAYLTGMRQNEIISAQWKDVVYIKDRVFITVTATTSKNRRARTIPLRDEVVKLLGSRGKGQIFQGCDRWNLRWAWSQALKTAKFKGRVRFHDLRHTFCRLYLEGGGTIADLMQITGHQSIVMMRVYANFEVKYKADRMDAIKLPRELEIPTGRPQDGHPYSQVTKGNVRTNGGTHRPPADEANLASSQPVFNSVSPSISE